MPSNKIRHIGFACILLLFIVSCTHKREYLSVNGFAQGGTYSLTYCSLDSSGRKIRKSPAEIKKIVDDAFLRIDNSLSGYNKGSTITAVNNGRDDISGDPIFLEMLENSIALHKETEGYFDVTGAPLFDIWGFGFQEKENITQEKIDSVLQFVGTDLISVENGRILRKDPRVKINFNAIAQGFSCDYIARSLDSLGFTDYLLEMGGEIICKGANPKGSKWRIAIDAPIDGNNFTGAMIQDIIDISNAGVVTSGNYRKYYIVDGQKYAHTINPHTGYPVQHNLLSATVIAKDATTADVYATYFMVVGIDRAKEILASRDDMEAYLIAGDGDGDNFITYFTLFDK